MKKLIVKSLIALVMVAGAVNNSEAGVFSRNSKITSKVYKELCAKFKELEDAAKFVGKSGKALLSAMAKNTELMERIGSDGRAEAAAVIKYFLDVSDACKDVRQFEDPNVMIARLVVAGVDVNRVLANLGLGIRLLLTDASLGITSKKKQKTLDTYRAMLNAILAVANALPGLVSNTTNLVFAEYSNRMITGLASVINQGRVDLAELDKIAGGGTTSVNTIVMPQTVVGQVVPVGTVSASPTGLVSIPTSSSSSSRRR
ncbi:MAG: hypothetical protein LBJ16_00225 [Holosporaceae bacterium]|jgi:hypothetical protein|nr:hypothetical protein [Holosporaceae bacterium]